MNVSGDQRRRPQWLVLLLELSGIALIVLIGFGVLGNPFASDEAQQVSVTVTIDTTAPIARVDERFLSFALDVSHILGGHWWGDGMGLQPTVGAKREAPYDLAAPRLRTLAAALAPAYLRFGGTEADNVYYNLDDDEATEVPEGYDLVLTREQLTQVESFAEGVGMDLMVTLNAGPSARDADGNWDPSNARSLLQTSTGVAVWELGNEVNAFPMTQRFLGGIEQYLRDLDLASQEVQAFASGSKLAGFASIFFPRVGEPYPLLTDKGMEGQNVPIDILTWHYYPQQSQRCLLANQPASADTLLEPATLDEISRWSQWVRDWRDRHAPQAALWLGEPGRRSVAASPVCPIHS